MTYSYKPKGVCARNIDITVEDDIVVEVSFSDSCPGNSLGLSKLIKGMKVDEVIEKLQGINCRGRGTSCPDQLAKALISMKEQ